jgi:hypothetical protein
VGCDTTYDQEDVTKKDHSLKSKYGTEIRNLQEKIGKAT